MKSRPTSPVSRLRLVAGCLCLAAVLAGCGGGDDPVVPPAPTATASTPSQGSEAGGTALTITGTDFQPGSTVDVGGNPATNVVVVNATTLTCTTPAGTGTVDVSVTTAGGTATLAGAFTYYPPPTVTATAPALVATEGGQTITLTGTGFTANGAGTNEVRIDGVLATNVNVVDDTTLECDTPLHSAGVVDVTVTNANGTATLSGGLTYAPRGILYFSQDNNGNGLFVVDTQTGTATLAGSGISGTTSNTIGLAPGNASGILFGSIFADLVTIQADGSGTTALSGEDAEALAYYTGDGLIYACINGSFKSIDPATGNVVNTLNSGGRDFEGLACDDANGLIYGIVRLQPNLWVYEIATDTWTDLGDLGAGNWLDPGLAYDPVLQRLYAIGGASADDNLYEIDPATVTATVIGPMGTTGRGGLAILPGS